ncbi:hypothetical protein KO481_08370 [Nocardia sp. NEAU-G5]|uniref:PPE family domain-containing protein n=1 Tax=Nocardia albiluteola TaxID=2842303 RepID=A0ABS6AU40_9NOCA|nr:hypothetical protein [Nocardia albiluteola]MBU3061536.1 hypothetical protein [Nocardia albiluteola]
MRRGTGLRRRPPVSARNAKSATTTSDPNVDPPIIARLVQPLLALRASLGTGAGTPNQAIVAALTRSTTQAAGTEAPHREGMQALESTWSGPAADAAVPALRTTRTQIGDISDRGPQYVQVLSEAQATSARAATKVDGIIADFRQDARTILHNAKAAPDTDAVITRASQALREAITAVNTAKTEMDGHTRKLNSMGPLTVTTPADLSLNDNSNSSAPTYSSNYSTNNSSYDSNGSNYGSNNSYSPDNSYTGAPNEVVNGNSKPLDPATAAQLQLQEQLLAAGVNVGSDAINAGVSIGSELIDKIAEVGEHAIDQGATVAEQAIPQLTNPSASGSGNGASTQPSLFNFGGGQAAQSAPAPAGTSTSILPPTPGAAAPSTPAPSSNTATPGASTPAPAHDPQPAPASPDTSTPAAPTHPAPPPAAGLALPPAPGSGGGDSKRDGQLGVTAPAAVEEMVPAAVIGDLGDDSF